jgi:intracellular sulfur oxidation DsrE/DsrF family protein
MVLLLGLVQAVPSAAQTGLTIDIPVVLKQAKVVFNMDHPAFEGDHPTGMNFMRLMTERFEQDKTQSEIIAIFHGAAGYMLLADATYNKVRGTTSGNPYKGMIAALQARGVRMEECGQTAHVHGWVNADFLPGVKVNAAANLRIVELVQQGFIQIQP